MQGFEPSPPDIVKSIQQRWLFTQWLRQRDGGKSPLSATFALATIADCRDDLSIVDVMPHNGTHRFRIFDHGRRIGSMYAGSCAGKFLDEVLPDSARAWTLETYEHVVQAHVPVYTVSRMSDGDGRPFLYERLLLPLSGDDGRVVRILALLEAISSEGTIERQELMTAGTPAGSVAIKAELRVP
jgi:hypothetical protein